MSKKSDYKQEKNPLLVVLYIAAVLLLLGCIAFFVFSSKERRKEYEEQIKRAAENETEYIMTERVRETESETEASKQEQSKTSASGASNFSKKTSGTDSDKKAEAAESGSESQSENESEGKSDSETMESDSETESSSESAENVKISFKEKAQTILVLNGTKKPGVAGNWKAKLEKLGYRKVVSASYNGEIDDNTVIYAEDDVKTEGLQHEFQNSVIKEGKVESGIEPGEGESLPEEVDVYVVVGRNDAVVESASDSE